MRTNGVFVSMPSKILSRTYASSLNAKAVFAALEPETGMAHEKRAKTVLTVKNNRVQATIHATDARGLRASVHTYTTLLDFVGRVENEIRRM